MTAGSNLRKKLHLYCCTLLFVIFMLPISFSQADDLKDNSIVYTVQDPGDPHFDPSLWRNETTDLIPEASTLCNRAVLCTLLSYLNVNITPVQLSSMGTSVVPATYYRYLIRSINQNLGCDLVRVHGDGDLFSQEHLMNYHRIHESDSSYSPVYIWGNYGIDMHPHTLLLLRAEDTEYSYRKDLWLFDPSPRSCDVGHIVYMNIDYRGRCRDSNVEFYRQHSFQIKWVLQFRRLDLVENPFPNGKKFKVNHEINMKQNADNTSVSTGTLNINRTVQILDYKKDPEGTIWYQINNGSWVISEYLEEK